MNAALINFIKHLIYLRGEPYKFSNNKLHFNVGSRPVRRKYLNSNNDIVRNDVLQIEYLENHFTNKDVLWDVGSHHGHYSIFAASVVTGDNQVFSFEPDGEARRIQLKNIELNGMNKKIKVFDCAVSNSDAEILFNAQGGNANSHIVKDDSSVIRGNVITLQSRSLNSLLDELPKPSYIKIDTEGAEIDILKGASNLLQMEEISFICELHPFAWPEFNVNFSEFIDIIEKNGRTIKLLDTNRSKSQLPYYGTILF